MNVQYLNAGIITHIKTGQPAYSFFTFGSFRIFHRFLGDMTEL